MKKTIQYLLPGLVLFTQPSFAENDNPTLTTYLDRYLSVSCDNAGKQCFAVGFGKEPHESNRLVYSTQDAGKTWSTPITLSPPKGVISAEESKGHNPAMIRCDASAQRCVIVSAAIIDKVPTPIVYQTLDSGLTWSEPETLPVPKALKKKQKFNYPSAMYTQVSCDYSGYNCIIAGGIQGDIQAVPFLYTTHDAGHTWTVNNLKDISNAPSSIFHGSALTGISCDNSGFFCKAVGYAMTKNSFWSSYYSSKPIVYITEDGGYHWKNPVVLPTDITNTNASTLLDIACSGSGQQCTAIGFTIDYATNLHQHFSYTTMNGGIKWEKRIQINSESLGSTLDSIDCDETGNVCTAVGWQNTLTTSTKVYKPLIYKTIDGAKSWAKNSQLSFSPLSLLNDIFCSSADSCIAVGTKVDLNATMFHAKQKQIVSPNLFFVRPPKPQKI